MSWMNKKLADIILDKSEEIGAPLYTREASDIASEILAHTDELWEDCAEHEPPVGEKLLFQGERGGMFLGVCYGDVNPDGTVWVKAMNGGRKARFWMEAPKERVVE